MKETKKKEKSSKYSLKLPTDVSDGFIAEYELVKKGKTDERNIHKPRTRNADSPE